MTIEELIEKLVDIQKNMPGAIVKFNNEIGYDISPIIQCSCVKEVPDLKFVCITDSNTELIALFDNYERRLKPQGVTEEDFFRAVLKNFSLEDIERNCPEKYEYSKEICEKYGLA